jgi:trehalose-6-phosphate synthase
MSIGMNLVAKEFVACQINQPPGVLIVSPFAGAGETMHEALICNPYEMNEAAEVLHRCVLMFCKQVCETKPTKLLCTCITQHSKTQYISG